MKIGVFDSGLGGLITLKALAKTLPQYDYVYLGDTKRVPYGNRSHETIYQFLKEGVEFLFDHDCALVVVACNTASAEALRTLQQNFLAKKYPDRRVLGMIIPLAEECVSFKKVGLIGTTATVSSGAYERELKKRAPSVHLYSVATPLLVPLIENGELSLATETARKYLAPLTAKKIDALILGCTHYPIIKNRIKKILPEGVRIISQDTVVPKKLREYLARHPEMEKRLSKKGRRVFAVTDVTPTLSTLAQKWFGAHVKIQKVSIGN